MSKKLENNKHISSFSFLILFVSMIFASLVGSGLYGFGIDYYVAYIKGFEWNIARATFFNYLSFRISTLIINEVFIGVYLVTFILSLSTGLLIRNYLKLKQIHSLFFFLLIFIITIHTWPIIMSTSNAMRQGLAMSFIFLSLISTLQKNYYCLIFFSLISTLMHLSGFFLAILIFLATIFDAIFRNFFHINKVIINFFIGIFLLIVVYFSLKIFIQDDDFEPSRIIGRDFRGAFVFIGFIYMFFSFFFRSMLANSYNLSLYYFNFASLAFLINGLNWQYERLGMMMLIPYILSFGVFLNKFSYKIYLILTFTLLFFLTIYTGMYSIGLT